ncbi:hypothetical protein DPMN_078117 [Dreissena polymorpha]|uniref:Uncharacterized protein n=1 Tax=Dreissena polymorpha TaxID=45954 RepID=A0A9D3YQK9_DREPO|nr:hypothetical protein DPMN_078117 [Dreissena polymorpha]
MLGIGLKWQIWINTMKVSSIGTRSIVTILLFVPCVRGRLNDEKVQKSIWQTFTHAGYLGWSPAEVKERVISLETQLESNLTTFNKTLQTVKDEYAYQVSALQQLKNATKFDILDLAEAFKQSIQQYKAHLKFSGRQYFCKSLSAKTNAKLRQDSEKIRTYLEAYDLTSDLWIKNTEKSISALENNFIAILKKLETTNNAQIQTEQRLKDNSEQHENIRKHTFNKDSLIVIILLLVVSQIYTLYMIQHLRTPVQRNER